MWRRRIAQMLDAHVVKNVVQNEVHIDGELLRSLKS